MFSVLILTLNEERNLPRCLASARASDDLVVLDSGSTDRTREVAAAASARVFVNRFENFAQQRNHAHREIPFRYPWVFHLDADEQLTPELVAECNTYRGAEPLDGCWVAPKMMFRGRWIRRCTDYPAWQARFVKARGFEFIEVGHGQREAPHMRMGRLHASYLHEVCQGGEAAWLEKHRRYAVAEARRHALDRERIRISDLLTSDPLERRRAMKRLSYALPARPIVRFMYQYVVRGGFRDGAAGWRYCRLLARYEGFTAAEIRRLRRAQVP
jgi:glycosyltransferase involved in cell wall biosynthesis